MHDCSPEALAEVVQPGMQIRKALSLCPELIVVAPDGVLYRDTWESVLDALSTITPQVEDVDQGGAFLNVEGLAAHYANVEALGQAVVDEVRFATALTATVGIGSGKLPARIAALWSQPGRTFCIEDGHQSKFLARVNVDMLPIDGGVIERLHMLGLDHMGDVARLSVPELQSQFGFDGKRLWHLVSGDDQKPLMPRPHREVVRSALALEAPAGSIETIVAVGQQLLSRLLGPLQGRAARDMTIRGDLTSLRSWEQRIVFREAVSDTDRLLFLLRSSITNTPPPTAINSLSLELGGLTGERGKQGLLFGKRPLQQQLEETIQHLKARYGHSPIYRCIGVETWSAVPEERYMLIESDEYVNRTR